MSLEDEQIESDVFNIPNSVDTQNFAFESDQLKSILNYQNSPNHYLREIISEPLSYALTYAVIYRPEDPIEFISEFLINWSRKIIEEKLINHPSKNQSLLINKSEENNEKYLLKKINSESNKQFFSFPYEDFSIKQEYIHEEKLSRQYIHLHDTATEFDDEQMKNKSHDHRCQNGNLSDLSYFSKLREKIINCDES